MAERNNSDIVPATVDDEERLKKADNFIEKIKALSSSEKYERGAKALLTANTALLITIVWKSLDLPNGLAWTAKISVFFFAVGAFLSVLRYIVDYLSEGLEHKPFMDEASAFLRDNKELLKEKRPDVYETWAVHAGIHERANSFLKKCCGGNDPSLVLIALSYVCLEYILIILSGAAFFIGLLFLLATAFFS